MSAQDWANSARLNHISLRAGVALELLAAIVSRTQNKPDAKDGQPNAIERACVNLAFTYADLFLERLRTDNMASSFTGVSSSFMTSTYAPPMQHAPPQHDYRWAEPAPIVFAQKSPEHQAAQSAVNKVPPPEPVIPEAPPNVKSGAWSPEVHFRALPIRGL